MKLFLRVCGELPRARQRFNCPDQEEPAYHYDQGSANDLANEKFAGSQLPRHATPRPHFGFFLHGARASSMAPWRHFQNLLSCGRNLTPEPALLLLATDPVSIFHRLGSACLAAPPRAEFHAQSSMRKTKKAAPVARLGRGPR